MKELFDAYFLEDATAREEYDNFTASVENHFVQLKKIAVGPEEIQAITALQRNYQKFVVEAPALFDAYQLSSDAASKRAINTDIETGLFNRHKTHRHLTAHRSLNAGYIAAYFFTGVFKACHRATHTRRIKSHRRNQYWQP
jgi:hypothetical protein